MAGQCCAICHQIDGVDCAYRGWRQEFPTEDKSKVVCESDAGGGTRGHLTYTCEEERGEVVKVRMMRGSIDRRASDEIVP